MDDELKIKGNIDINEALEEFEKKSATEEKQKSLEVSETPDVPKMVKWVMKFSGGIIKEQKQAEYVLLGFVVLTISISVFLFFSAFRSSSPPDQITNVAGPGK